MSVSKKWSILWFLPILGQRASTREPECRQTYTSCEGVCFASLGLDDGLVDVAFEEDVIWFRDGRGKKEGDGIATVKVGLRIQQPKEGILSTVECDTTFSQPSQGVLRVHSSWPAGPGTESCAQRETRDSNPCFHMEHAGYERCPQANQSDRNTPAFSSIQMLSPGRISGHFDLVRHTLFIEHEPYPIIRKHRGAFVLCCANDLLIVTTLLKVFRKQARGCADLGTVENHVKPVKASIRIEMEPRDASVALHAPCGDMEQWVDVTNRRSNNRITSRIPTATPISLSGSPEPKPHSGLSQFSNGSPCISAEWFDRLRKVVHEVLIPDPNIASGVKIAIIDTGANFSINQYRTLHRERISGCRTWCGVDMEPSGRSFMNANGHIADADLDKDTHGTHSLSVLRKVAPNCMIFVAQVFRDRHEILEGYPSEDQAWRIAKAIDYAATEEQVDIISMSFGFRDEIPVIRDAINRAATRAVKPCLLFAAASNFGGNEDVQWPASHSSVICVHAADGVGNGYDLNVVPKYCWREFSTLGCGVEAFVGPEEAIRSGTSVASPVAAGIAALILGEALVKKAKYLAWVSKHSLQQAEIYDEKLYRLRTCEGMSRVLKSMSASRHGYNYLRPWKLLCKDSRHECFLVDKILAQAAGENPVIVCSDSTSGR